MKLFLSSLEIIPLCLTFFLAIFSVFVKDRNKWQDITIGSLGFLFILFSYIFFKEEFTSTFSTHHFFDMRNNRISVFIGAIYCASLFIGLYPVRKSVILSPTFLFSVSTGLGIISSNNLPTFFIFWTLQRSIFIIGFVRESKNNGAVVGATYIIQHFLAFLCFLALLFYAYTSGYLLSPMTQIGEEFFTWPVILLSFVIIYESHGLFPFQSWVHDIVGKIPWFEFSSIFLTRSGVLLFVQLLLPTLKEGPDSYKIVLLSFSIFSSIYWSSRGILEQNLSKTTTYFYIAQASLLLTGLQADQTAAIGSYMHMMVISLSGTSLFSILSYVQLSFSFKRPSHFYGLAQYYPILATLFCLFGFCMIGVPLGASHVVEDLVITGLLEHQPYLGLGHILATCLNGILFFMIFSKIFLGPSPYKTKIKNKDMSLAQMIPYLLTLIILIMVGVMPYLFLEKIPW